MPIYLDEDQMGADANVIGFPHLLLCMGLVCVTENHLYGIHLTDINKTNELTDVFSGWLSGQGIQGTDLRALYGSANLVVRYTHGGVAGPNSNFEELWKVEMTRVARRMGYRGPVYGFNAAAIVPKDGFYAEYHARHTNHTCRIFYKRNEKMNYVKAPAVINAQQIKPSETFPEKHYRDGRYTPPMEIPTSVGPITTPTTSATIVATSSNNGQLHEVDYALRLMQFLHL